VVRGALAREGQGQRGQRAAEGPQGPRREVLRVALTRTSRLQHPPATRAQEV
jgi:hypothetical protein